MFGSKDKYNYKQLENQYKGLEIKTILLIKECQQLEKHISTISEKLGLYMQHQTTPRKQKLIKALDEYRNYERELKNYYYPESSVLNSVIDYIKRNHI